MCIRTCVRVCVDVRICVVYIYGVPDNSTEEEKEDTHARAINEERKTHREKKVTRRRAFVRLAFQSLSVSFLRFACSPLFLFIASVYEKPHTKKKTQDRPNSFKFNLPKIAWATSTIYLHVNFNTVSIKPNQFLQFYFKIY